MSGVLIMNDTGCLSTREKLIGLALASPLLLILAFIIGIMME